MNLLPLLEGRIGRRPLRELYFLIGVQFAVRQGDWKLVKASREMAPLLVNLAGDPAEQHDLTAREPERARVLQALFERWISTIAPPRREDRRWDGEEDRKASRPGRKDKGRQAGQSG